MHIRPHTPHLSAHFTFTCYFNRYLQKESTLVLPFVIQIVWPIFNINQQTRQCLAPNKIYTMNLKMSVSVCITRTRTSRLYKVMPKLKKKMHLQKDGARIMATLPFIADHKCTMCVRMRVKLRKKVSIAISIDEMKYQIRFFSYQITMIDILMYT